MNEDWTKKEATLIVADYFEMLEFELQNQKYNKAAHNRGLLPLLNERTRGAIESKHQNISAVLKNMGLPFINGYKPLHNYQGLLEQTVAQFLKENRIHFEKWFEIFAENEASDQAQKIDFETILDEEPESSIVEEREPTYRPIKINYLEKEQNNRNLGEKGEKLVIDYERWRLIKAGKEALADKIEWISKEKGDGTGYDILSKNINGTDRYVEVKTTKLSKEVPIYLTRTELAFANKNAENFYLYRVFNFDSKPQFFIREGNYESFCTVQPMTFKGIF